MKLENLTFQGQAYLWPEPPECDCMSCCLEWTLQIVSSESDCYDELEQMEDPRNEEEPSELAQEGAALVYARGRIEYEISNYITRNMSADERSLLMAEPVGFT